MSSSETYKVRFEFGQLYIRDSSNKLVDFETFDALVTGLMQTRNLMISSGKSHAELYRDAIEQRDKDISANIQMEYPFTDEWAIHKLNSARSRPRKAKRFYGVYILTTLERPEIVKIGQSIDLYNRSKGLRYELSYDINDPHFETIAFIHTKELDSVEQFLHQLFADACVGGEWFQRAPVTAWLKQFRGQP